MDVNTEGEEGGPQDSLDTTKLWDGLLGNELVDSHLACLIPSIHSFNDCSTITGNILRPAIFSTSSLPLERQVHISSSAQWHCLFCNPTNAQDLQLI